MPGSRMGISSSMLRTESISASRVGSSIPSSALTIVFATAQPYTWNGSSGSARGSCFSSPSLYSIIAGSSAHCGSSGSMKYDVETMPWAFSSPTGSSTSFFEAPTLLRMCSTFQPSFA